MTTNDEPLCLSRRVLHPGDWTYVWQHSLTPSLDPRAWTLVGDDRKGGKQKTYPIARSEHPAMASLQPWDAAYHHALAIPVDLPAGEYDLRQKDVAVGTITVRDPPQIKRTAVAHPSGGDRDADNIEALLSMNDRVVLNGGTYLFDRPVRVPADRQIYGYGATVVRLWINAGHNSIFSFSLDGRIWIQGLTFSSSPTRRPIDKPYGSMVSLSGPQDTTSAPNVTLKRCRFENCHLGEWAKPGFLADGCVFQDAGTDLVTGPALFLDCTWRGKPDPGPEWLMWGGTGLALIGCEFIGTGRGPVFQGNRDTIHNNLVCGLTCDRIDTCENDCEGLAIEGVPPNECNNNLFLHLRYRGEGPGIHFDHIPARGNIVRDFLFDGGQGIDFYGDNDVQTGNYQVQTGNYLLDGEIRGGGCTFGAGAMGNVMRNVSFIGPRPGRGNHFAYGIDPAPQTVIYGAERNDVDESVRAVGMPDGWKKSETEK